MRKVNISINAVLFVLAAAVPGVAQAPGADVTQVRARQRISTMEGALNSAVTNAAQNLIVRVNTIVPDTAMLTGRPEVRGVRLPGYGVLFFVDVPGLAVSVAWPLRAMINDTRAASLYVAQLKERAAALDPRERAPIMQIVAQLEATLPPPAQPFVRSGSPIVSAAASGEARAAVAPPPVEPVDPDVLNDPYDMWTREVKTALIEEMLQSSAPLGIAPDEWLSVVARDSAPSDPLMPGATIGLSTMIFRVKGSDLAEFHARRLTLEDAVKRVEAVEE